MNNHYNNNLIIIKIKFKNNHQNCLEETNISLHKNKLKIKEGNR